MITMNEIVREDVPSLHERSVDVTFPLSEEDKETMRLMMEYLSNSQDDELAEKYDLRSGIGLAAPQIGSINGCSRFAYRMERTYSSSESIILKSSATPWNKRI